MGRSSVECAQQGEKYMKEIMLVALPLAMHCALPFLFALFCGWIPQQQKQFPIKLICSNPSVAPAFEHPYVVGVATAFNAPIGGLLFAFEEVASFFGISLGWQAGMKCLCAFPFSSLLLVQACFLLATSPGIQRDQGPFIFQPMADACLLLKNHFTMIALHLLRCDPLRPAACFNAFIVAMKLPMQVTLPAGSALVVRHACACMYCITTQVFFACMCATLALNLSKSAGAALTGRGHFGWFDSE
eukprot:scaffold99049_cov18-Tisochrysis_lutea.AAC.2